MTHGKDDIAKMVRDGLGGAPQNIGLAMPLPGCLRLTLMRPHVRNAFDETMIRELSQVVFYAQSRLSEHEFRVLHLCGEGPVFCAGADLDMMARLGQAGYESNLEDARRLSRLFEALAACPVPVVLSAQGAAIGGGFGLAVCADVVVTHKEAVFATTEVRLGLVPSVISPYIIRKIGVAAAGLPLLSGMRLDGVRARELGLAQVLVEEPGDVSLAADGVLRELLACAPGAQRETKKLIHAAVPLPAIEIRANTEATIARIRSAPEAQYGLKCFFEKRSPDWGLRVEEREAVPAGGLD